jgi:hypothetical protein
MSEWRIRLEDSFIENFKASTKVTTGTALTFETELVLRFTYAKGLDTGYEEGFKNGVAKQKYGVIQALGLVDTEPNP